MQAVTNTWGDTSLAIDDRKQDFEKWKQYPIYLTQEQLQALNVPRILRAIGKGGKSPSQMAGIPSNQRCAMLERIDNAYQDTMKKYADELKHDTDADIDTIKRLEKEASGFAAKAGAGTSAGLGGAGALAVQCKIITLASGPAAPIVCVGSVLLVGAVVYKLASDAIEADIQRKGSTQRYAWLIRVDQDEERHEKKWCNSISLRLSTIDEIIEEKKARNLPPKEERSCSSNARQVDKFHLTLQAERDQLNKVLNLFEGAS